MSSVGEHGEGDLKAGHPPAVKAGGMRVARHRTSSQGDKGEPPVKPEEGEEEDYETTSPPKEKQQIIISGAVSKGDKDFPPEAVKQYHEKPVPAKEKRPMHQQHNIQQPR